jgi:tetratricopeptide (TPR) repeat protein
MGAMRVLLAPLLVLASAAIAAPAPPALTAALEKVETDAPANRVLNQLQAATLALDLGRDDDAGRLFDEALTGVTAVYADSAQAAAARGLWRNEGSKDYKGEPYERAMAFYYRGLLDMQAGDYENARASFKSGLLQDAFAEEAQNRADFALLMFLEAWSSQMLGADSLAEERYAELASLRPGIPRPGADHRLLIIAETGKAPRKLQDGVGGNLLVYRRGKRFTEQGAQIRINGQVVRMSPAEDIFWQASTRGGRPIDGILEGKVQFKQGSERVAANTAGAVAQIVPQLSAQSGSAAGAAAGVALVASVAALVSTNIKGRADNRFWNNLPDQVHLYTLPMPTNPGELTFEFLDASGAVIPELTQTRRIQVDDKGRGILWVRARRATDVDSR